MAKRSQKHQKTNTKLQELVIVTTVEDMELAREYETLLKTNDIPAMTKEQPENPTGIKSVAIMVPEDFLDEAHVVIESQDAYDDFYDLSLEDEDTADFENDFLDDEL